MKPIKLITVRWACEQCLTEYVGKDQANECCMMSNRDFNTFFRQCNNVKGYENVCHDKLPPALKVRYGDMIDSAYRRRELTQEMAENYKYNSYWE